MKNKPNAARKGTAAPVKAPPPREDLAVLLSKVLTHPALPGKLEQYIGEGLCELYNDLVGDFREVDYAPAHIALLFKAHAKTTRGRREGRR